MKPRRAIFPLFCAAAALWLVPVSTAAQAAAGIDAGLWEGSLTLKQVAFSAQRSLGAQNSLSSKIRLRLLEKGRGALIDIPEQSMYGYPLDNVVWSGNTIRFAFGALGPDEELVFEGFFSATAGVGASASAPVEAPAPDSAAEASAPEKTAQGGAIIGMAASASWKGTFILFRSGAGLRPGEQPLALETQDGVLPGTLFFPPAFDAGHGSLPVVLLLSGAGSADRNGNNYNVPGKPDSLSMLAEALAQRGVASYRYDKRGSGEAYMLEQKGHKTSLLKQADDAAAALELLQATRGVSRLVVVGMNEGAWVGAAAANKAAQKGIMIDGLVVVDSSGEKPFDTLRSSLANLDEALQKEAEAAAKALVAGEAFPEPSGVLADFFAAERREWLKSWLSFDPAAEIAKVRAPVLFVFGDADLQVSREAFEKLLEARPSSAARVIPSMNYALKEVRTEEENYDSFTDPRYPVPGALADLLAAFARVRPLPPGSLPYAKK